MIATWVYPGVYGHSPVVPCCRSFRYESVPITAHGSRLIVAAAAPYSTAAFIADDRQCSSCSMFHGQECALVCRQLVARYIVPPVAAQVLPSSSQGDHVAPASRLLATILQLFGADSIPSPSAGR